MSDELVCGRRLNVNIDADAVTGRQLECSNVPGRFDLDVCALGLTMTSERFLTESSVRRNTTDS